MANILELISQLEDLGVELWLNGTRLCYRAPSGVMTPDLRAKLSDHKTEIVEFLWELQNNINTIPSKNHYDSLENKYPLSSAQQRLWFQAQFDSDSPAHHIFVLARISGILDIPTLHHALQSVVQRHAVLRTIFRIVDHQSFQVVSNRLMIHLPLVDLTHLPPDARYQQAVYQAQVDALLPFDLLEGPLFRTKLFCLGKTDYLFSLTMHHIVSDNWSCGILLREVQMLYEAFLAGGPPPLPELPMQYVDFAVQQRQWLHGPYVESMLSYWKQNLCEPITATILPTDHVRPAMPSGRGARVPFALPSSLVQDLTQLSHSLGSTLFMTLLTVFKTLLYCYTGKDDIVIGVPVANRNAETVALIGYFINVVVLRTRLDRNNSFVQYLTQVREVTLNAYAHQDIPFEEVVETIWNRQDSNLSPFFNIVFNFRNSPLPNLSLAGLKLEIIEPDLELAKYDLTLYMWEEGENLVGAFVYSTDLFELATINRLKENYLKLVELVATSPELTLETLKKHIGDPEQSLRAQKLRDMNRERLEMLIKGKQT